MKHTLMEHLGFTEFVLLLCIFFLLLLFPFVLGYFVGLAKGRREFLKAYGNGKLQER